MFAKISNSWALIKASAAVLRADKELIVFPIVSGIVMLVVTATFAFPMILTGMLESLFLGDSQVLGAIVAFLFYVVQYTIIIFANSALVGAAMIRLEGGDPTLSDGFRIAFRRIIPILSYALIAATVGMILRWISERVQFVGPLVASLFGLAWDLATYLVVPVLVVEGVGPIEAVKRSAILLKQTWGEQIVGNFGIGIIFALVAVPVIILGIVVIALAASAESLAIIVVTVVVIAVVLVLIGLINSTLSGIYLAAVYRYAAQGQVSGFFSEDMVREAFLPKK
ncbi:MAG: hypothetical protein KKA73_24245 [Chloroflexi bacterium]|nr:hypothetical protein [Chloroflexota bacterium]MBU1750804.1 hypothetical protein [Chloroflexota bacterium]